MKTALAALVLSLSIFGFTANSETLVERVNLPKGRLTINCAPFDLARNFSAADANEVEVRRISTANAIRYEVYFQNSLVCSCDNVAIFN